MEGGRDILGELYAHAISVRYSVQSLTSKGSLINRIATYADRRVDTVALRFPKGVAASLRPMEDNANPTMSALEGDLGGLPSVDALQFRLIRLTMLGRAGSAGDGEVIFERVFRAKQEAEKRHD